jgi:transcriptional regulator with XRE-family HTH domain
MIDRTPYVTLYGPRLRDWRIGAGLTVTQAAAATGIAETVIWSYEAGRKRFTLEVVELFARTYGRYPETIFGMPDAVTA